MDAYKYFAPSVRLFYQALFVAKMSYSGRQKLKKQGVCSMSKSMSFVLVFGV
jgi:hypothetical protein